jgi:hypothetical protein
MEISLEHRIYLDFLKLEQEDANREFKRALIKSFNASIKLSQLYVKAYKKTGKEPNDFVKHLAKQKLSRANS